MEVSATSSADTLVHRPRVPPPSRAVECIASPVSEQRWSYGTSLASLPDEGDVRDAEGIPPAARVVRCPSGGLWGAWAVPGLPGVCAGWGGGAAGWDPQIRKKKKLKSICICVYIYIYIYIYMFKSI